MTATRFFCCALEMETKVNRTKNRTTERRMTLLPREISHHVILAPDARFAWAQTAKIAWLLAFEFECIGVGIDHQTSTAQRFALVREEYGAVGRLARRELALHHCTGRSRRRSLHFGGLHLRQRGLAALLVTVGRQHALNPVE